MSGTDLVFNIAKGKVAYYATLPAANDALIVVLLKSSGLVADGTLADYDDLSALLAGTSDECDATAYVRKTAASVTVTPDDTNDRQDADFADVVWTALGGASNNTIAKLIVCYDGDTTAGTDANIIPLTAHSFDVTTDGTDLTAVVANFFRAS
jgi:hypothetical protein